MDVMVSPMVVFGLVVFVYVVSGFFTVKQQAVAIIERFGKFHRLAMPGLRLRIPLIESISGSISMRIMQLEVRVETKTHDNVFLDMTVAVQYQVLPGKIFESYYMLTDPCAQIQSFVFDLVRAEVPKLILDEVFSKKDDIASAVKHELQDQMTDFGFHILKALVVDIQPDPHVKQAMNEINTAQRLRVASLERGEAEKIMRVKQAEGECEANVLQGRGVAGQRREILAGLSASVDEMTRQHPEISVRQVMDMVLLIQYFDMMREVGAQSKSNMVFVPHSPGSMGSLHDQLRETVFAGEAFKKSLDQ